MPSERSNVQESTVPRKRRNVNYTTRPTVPRERSKGVVEAVAIVEKATSMMTVIPTDG